MTYPAHFRKLYEQSEGEALGLSFPDFAQALSERSPTGQSLHLKDLALALGCSRGIPTAWDRFSHRYGERLYASALVLSRNESIARELADSIYGDLFASKLASYSGRGSLEGWLKAVLSQAYIDRYRSGRRIVSLDDRLATIEQTLFSDLPTAVDPRLTEAVQQTLLALPPDQRYLLAGYFFDQRTLAELARTLGVHESTVSRRLDRLIKLLRVRITRILREKGMTMRQVQESFKTDVRDLSLDLRGSLIRE
jgi:RNA polymerase sigma-70 factor (ECF subfamily)